MKSGGILLIVIGTWICFQVLGGDALVRLNVITHDEDLGNTITGQGHALGGT